MKKIGIGMLILLWSVSLFAAEIRWSTKPYVHVSDEQPIEEFLKEFCASLGIKVVISKSVSGETVSGSFKQAPKLVFQQIASAFDIIWYYDGNVLYIYRSNELKSKIVSLSHLSTNQFQKQLVRMGIPDKKYPLKMYPGEKLVYVTGPEHYVNIIVKTAQLLEKKAAARKANSVIQKTTVAASQRLDTIQFFPLSYAWAADVDFNFAGTTVTMPGVASILRNLMSESNRHNPLETDKKYSNAPQILKPVRKNSKRKSKSQNNSDTPAVSPLQSTGIIQADPRLNAVIVRDLPERMPLYEDLIQELDVPVSLIEIKATIMDINLDKLRNIGVDFAGQRTNEDAINDKYDTTGFLSSGNAPNSSFGEMAFDPANNLSNNLGGGLNFTTIIGDLTGNFLIARLNAMEEEGDAKIISEPSVITFNNVEAQLEHSATFYVRVAGTDEVELYEVSSGITLKVTPHVITQADSTRIKLAVNIQDGNVSDTLVDGLPMVQKSTINTQAIVGENESLLIGGLIQETDSTTERKIPLLGDIPILGYLFKFESTSKVKSERLFKISPKIITREPAGL